MMGAAVPRTKWDCGQTRGQIEGPRAAPFYTWYDDKISSVSIVPTLSNCGGHKHLLVSILYTLLRITMVISILYKHQFKKKPAFSNPSLTALSNLGKTSAISSSVSNILRV